MGTLFFHTKRIFSACMATVFLLILTAFCVHMSVSVQAYAAPGRTECFTSIQVQHGESLQTISARYYSREYKSREAHMQRIKNMNHMTSDTVHEGAYLIVPYYREM